MKVPFPLLPSPPLLFSSLFLSVNLIVAERTIQPWIENANISRCSKFTSHDVCIRWHVIRTRHARRALWMKARLSRLTRFRKSRARRPDAREKIKEVASREGKVAGGKEVKHERMIIAIIFWHLGSRCDSKTLRGSMSTFFCEILREFKLGVFFFFRIDKKGRGRRFSFVCEWKLMESRIRRIVAQRILVIFKGKGNCNECIVMISWIDILFYSDYY